MPTQRTTKRQSATRVPDNSSASVVEADTTLFSKEEWRTLADAMELSPRALQIVSRLLTNATEAEISAELGISRHTVHAHIERVYRKLNVRSRVDLTVRVVSQFLGRNVDV